MYANLFGERLLRINYNQTQFGGAPIYNGNIAETYWKTSNDGVLRRYRYEYDALNRLQLAAYNLGDNSQPNRYSESGITYDRNGNILTLQRMGHTNSGATTFDIMDNLVYTYYDGNKLIKVADSANDTYGFVDGSDGATEYSYDQNGNMTSDANKGITGITYNHLNLPTTIVTDSGNISYVYDAMGIKLEKTVSVGSSVTSYAGNYVYQNSVLQFMSHPEGYATPDGMGGYDYVYQYKDHLENIRLSYADDGNGNIEILSENNYYPFGLKHKGYNNQINGVENNYMTFQGKEHQKELGLETYDFGFRAYDPAIARWTVIDPLAERRVGLTPYNFVQNSPMFRIDPNGLTDFKLNKETGEVEKVKDTDDKTDRIVKTDKDGNVKKKGEGFLGFLVRKSERGKAKTAIADIEKGILEDGQNFKTEDNFIDVGGENQATVEGVRDFTLKLSNYVGVEIGGFDLSRNGESEISNVFLGRYVNNKADEARTTLRFDSRPDLFGTTSVRTSFHTHLSRFGDAARLNPSRSDLNRKKAILESYPHVKFLILTNPENKPF